MPISDRLPQYLRTHNLRLTQPRQVVFEFLVSAGEPVKLSQIIALHGVWADRASLYRTVKLFKKLEIIREVHRSGGDWLELGGDFSPHHHHLTCAECGLTKTIDNRQLESQLLRIARADGFTVTDHQVEITGSCYNCLLLSSQQ